MMYKKLMGKNDGNDGRKWWKRWEKYDGYDRIGIKDAVRAGMIKSSEDALAIGSTPCQGVLFVVCPAAHMEFAVPRLREAFDRVYRIMQTARDRNGEPYDSKSGVF